MRLLSLLVLGGHDGRQVDHFGDPTGEGERFMLDTGWAGKIPAPASEDDEDLESLESPLVQGRLLSHPCECPRPGRPACTHRHVDRRPEDVSGPGPPRVVKLQAP